MALDTYALTTLARFKAWIGDTTSTNDTLYEYAINSASRRVESYTGREFVSRNRIEFYDPRGVSALRLKQYPITQCRFVGYGMQTALTVSANAQAADLTATVQVRENDIITCRNLSTITPNVEVVYDFTPGTGAYTMASQVQPLIDGATGFHCTLDNNAPLRYLHKTGPIDVVDNPAALTYPDISATDYIVDAERGIIHLGKTYRSVQWPTEWTGTFGQHPQTVVVEYTAGYSTVPADVEEACWTVAAHVFRSRNKDLGVNSESLGDYSYVSRGAAAINEILSELLADWREIR